MAAYPTQDGARAGELKLARAAATLITADLTTRTFATRTVLPPAPAAKQEIM